MRLPFRTFTVLPHLPERLQSLQKLAYNLWWCWNQEAVALFRRIDAKIFEQVNHNPVKLLSSVSQERLESLTKDDGFLAHLDRVDVMFEIYMNATTWYQEQSRARAQKSPASNEESYIAYFSAEFGLNESVPVYSGGLGVLAGDHLKAASDLGIPLVGVGLMYREGYFRQYLNAEGWQQERYPENDFFHLPLIPETNEDGSPKKISVSLPGRELHSRIWRLQVGRVPLYLLDTNIPENNESDRQITGRLYGGDHEMRIKQEILLGIGGVRALQAIGKEPTVCHMNEGHSAFCGLERIRQLIDTQGLDFESAREAVKGGTIFTTHTPVPAGNDVFAPTLIEQYFGEYVHSLKIDMPHLLDLARERAGDQHEGFCMTVLALRLADFSNGVSKLHGEVSRSMWKGIWPNLPEAEVPIKHVTNGVHTSSWVSSDMILLFDRYLGPQWRERPEDASIWAHVENIPDTELWRTHERRRERLVSFARERAKKQLLARAAPPAELARAEEVLDPEALTIGFARRFATYKRGALIFKDLDRLSKILNDSDRPVQLIFSGKAHPRDNGGKELIAEISHIARRPELCHRIVFLEDYDMTVARYLVQGVDVWLNNPRRPLEASGTSGMKSCVNGGLNLSILDGWWDEAYDGTNGWAIGAGEEYTTEDLAYQDEVECRAIYELLEKEIVPLFYTRSSDGLPRGWLKKMKACMTTICPIFNTGRMVAEYMNQSYWPAIDRHYQLTDESYDRANQLADWRQKARASWSQIKVESAQTEGADPMRVGTDLEVKAYIRLGTLTPEDVEVQLFHGILDSMGGIPEPELLSMSHQGTPADGSGVWTFTGTIPCRSSGQHGYAVRVLPRHRDLAHPYEPGLICWG